MEGKNKLGMKKKQEFCWNWNSPHPVNPRSLTSTVLQQSHSASFTVYLTITPWLYKTLSELHFDCEWHLGLVWSSSFEQSFMQNTQINVGAFVGIVFAKSAIKESNILFFTPGDFCQYMYLNKYRYICTRHYPHFEKEESFWFII